MNLLGSNIRFLIKKRGTSQEEVAKRAGISQVALHKIIAGKTKKTGRLLEIAAALGVTGEQLQNENLKSADSIGVSENLAPYAGSARRLPLISWTRAGGWDVVEDPYEVGDAEDWLLSPIEHGPRAFLVRNQGLSMYRSDGDGYPDKAILQIDPDVEAGHGSDVVVRTPDGNATFKRLQVEGNKKYLLALNENWPNRIMEVPENTVIVGVCTGYWVNRR